MPSEGHMPAVTYAVSPSTSTPLRQGVRAIMRPLPITIRGPAEARNFQTSFPVAASRQ
jgi:hypothetical protein